MAPVAEINITPMVDVMLVLLIIFMVTAPLLTAGVPLDLPESRANALAAENDQVTVSIVADGTVYIDERAVSRAELPAALAAIPQGPGGTLPLVTLRADRALDYGVVMGVMGELNRIGFTQISLVTNSGGNARRAPDAAVSGGSDDET